MPASIPSMYPIRLDGAGQATLAAADEPTTTSSAFGCTLIVSRGKGATVENDTISSDNAVIFIDVVQDTNNDLVTYGFPSTHTNLVIGFGLPLYLTDANALGFDPTGLAVVTSDQTQEAIEELDAAVDGVTTDVAALPSLASGSYSPTVTDVANIDSSITRTAIWNRIGDFVTVYGQVYIDPTAAATQTQVRVTVPVATDIDGGAPVRGQVMGYDFTGLLEGDSGTDEVLITIISPDTSSREVSYIFTYEVV